jgi:hypothetical protein
MSLWSIEDEKLKAVPQIKLSKEERIENWIVEDVKILGIDILIFGRQVITEFGGRIDLLGMDEDGSLQIIELKREKTPREIVAQILDYASWIKDLPYSVIDDISEKFLNKDIATAYSEKYEKPIPENINDSHSMIIVASELDDSSERIVQYLSEYGLSINCIFFNVFTDNNHEYLGRSWLMDPIDIDEIKDLKKRKPWNGYWFYNVGESNHRNWDDYIKYNFIAAGGGEFYCNQLKKLKCGNRFFAYMKGLGYVGYGEVVIEAKPIDDFVVEGCGGKKLYELDLVTKDISYNHDNEKTEWIVGVNWIKTFARDNAKRFLGAFANQAIVCRLMDNNTFDFLKKEFGIITE